ncbi:hypothetical protein [Limnobacter sp. P1]|uniref:hypothetical protein n=1 Tax=Limnobacter olei TaxID=3031298 RepID=UPI0023AF9408|nr:hypothetical protein [Limnobacter sp. P1]
MNVVIYTDDLEPITIIDLPIDFCRMGYERRFVRVAVPMPLMATPMQEDFSFPNDIHIVTLMFDKLRKRNKQGQVIESWIITTDDEVLALKLKPAWLPGQRGAINDYERIIESLSTALFSTLRGSLGD